VTRWAGLAAGVLVFAVLATANAGGYRYGVSDQAFYVPAIAKGCEPALFPRDAPLLATQTRLLLSDDLIGWVARASGLDLPPIFLALYALTLVVLVGGAAAFARASGYSWWAVAAFVLLLTLRHRITKTAANSLEGYMHPRELAFAFGVAGLAAIVASRYLQAAIWISLSALLHPTTALWFGIALIVAAAAGQPAWRRTLALFVAIAAAVAVWGVLAGPLAGRLVRMDAPWLQVLAERDYLFPAAWPAYAWIANLAYPVLIVTLFRRRRALGVATEGEGPLVLALLALFAMFLVSVPLTVAHLALAVQFQVTRVFWLMDFVAVAYVAWWLIDAVARSATMRVVVLAVILGLFSVRGFYVLAVEQRRPLVTMSLPDTPWVQAMTWLRTQPIDWQVLADPDHARKYGASVRVAAERDTVLEAGKDPAIAMYDREIAMRVAERRLAFEHFDALSAADFRALGARFDVSVLVVEQARRLDLPELYRNAGFAIYDLR
jgi:hypothetical protein